MDPDPASLSHLAYFFQHAPGAALEPGALLAGIVVLLLLLFASALFSGSEVALFSLNDQARGVLRAQDDGASARVLRLLEQPRQLLVSILILNTLVNVAAAILAAMLTAAVAQTYGLHPGLTVVLEVVVLTFVLLVLSEISPKLIATKNNVAFSRWTSALLLPLHRALFPVSSLLARSAQAVHGRFKPGVRRISPDDLKVMAEIGEAHGTLEEEERELIYSIVEFGETTVREIMVSRLDIVALPVTATLSEALEVIRTSGHSRLPLYIEHLDNILGVVYAKDLLPYLQKADGNGRRLDWARIARPAIFVPVGKKLDDLLKDFQTKKTHIAIVVDEYGGTAGLVTLEDVLEEIVGDIRDEHDDAEEELFEQIDPQTYRFDARINLDDINDVLGLELDTEEYDFETLGGFIFHLTGTIPSEGDEVVYDGLKMRVETVENHRIGRVLVQLVPVPEPEDVPEEVARSRDAD